MAEPKKAPFDYLAMRRRERLRCMRNRGLEKQRKNASERLDYMLDVLNNSSKARDVVEEIFDKAINGAATGVLDELKAPIPANPSVEIDAEQLFQLFAIYCGDVERTALAAGLSKELVAAQADLNGWRDKLKLLIDLRTSARPGDSERGINRAINFVQAHRYRNLLQRVLSKLAKLDGHDLDEMICTVDVDKAGNISRKISTRAFADLASALEKCHAMTYASLNDTVGERKERQDEPETHRSAAELHLQITKAMEEVRMSGAQVHTPEPNT